MHLLYSLTLSKHQLINPFAQQADVTINMLYPWMDNPIWVASVILHHPLMDVVSGEKWQECESYTASSIGDK